jgi:hypothetical protein
MIVLLYSAESYRLAVTLFNTVNDSFSTLP